MQLDAAAGAQDLVLEGGLERRRRPGRGRVEREGEAANRLAGMISDGDLRRLLERDGPHALERTAGDIMNPRPVTIDGSAFASAARALMEEKKITSLIVVSEDGHAQRVLHLHDLWNLQLI